MNQIGDGDGVGFGVELRGVGGRGGRGRAVGNEEVESEGREDLEGYWKAAKEERERNKEDWRRRSGWR